jgi:nitrate reductase NapA
VNPAVRIIEVATRTTRTSYAVDHSLLHAPHAAPAIANGICNEIVARKVGCSKSSSPSTSPSKRGRTNIGDGLANDTLVTEEATDSTWREYLAFLAGYEPERAQKLSGRFGVEHSLAGGRFYGRPAAAR